MITKKETEVLKERERQVKSRERVTQHGEVFTAEREVNAMLDLVKDETERIDSRFLEPACGDGNFLAEILRRKLGVVNKQYGRNLPDYEKYSILALSSIYGVDLLEDNIEYCRERLYDIWKNDYLKKSKSKAYEDCKKSARYILSKNILCGDALTMKKSDGKPIIFAQWDFVIGDQIKRRDYRLDDLLIDEDAKIVETNQMSILDIGLEWEFDEETKIKMPSPIKEYPLIDYRKVFEYEQFI